MAVPYMPLYIADYQADTGHLTTIEHGAYLLLIMTYWQRGGPLPADDKKLARICKVNAGQWTRIKATLLEFFEVRNDEAGKQLCHSKIDYELSRLHDKSLKKQKGGLARAQQMLSERSARGQLYVGVGDTVAKATDAGASSDKQFWEGAKAYLGKSKAGMIGKWCSQYGQPDTARAITAAQLERAVDPVPYIEKVLRRSKADSEEVPIC